MARRPMPSAADIAAATVAGAQSKGQANYRKGVARVTENPAAKAAQKLEKAKQGYINAIDSGKTARGLARTTLQSWQAAASTKGGNNYASGMKAAEGKIVAYQNAVRSQIEALRDEVNAMPDDTLEERVARSAAMQLGMARIAANRS